MVNDIFTLAAEKTAGDKLDSFRTFSFDEVMKQPEVVFEDIVVAGKEVQLTVFRQVGLPDISDAVLLTVQIARASLGGIVSYHYEKGLVFFPNGGSREATENELLVTGG